ncbi:MAG: hypothetical protein KGS45_05875 [Planctomycetes bacterium]|nr:hypothetical protein [Planctomycetota bacterium]
MIGTMLKNVLAWVCTVVAVFALGPLVTYPMKRLHALDGSADVTLLVNRSPMLGIGLLALLLIAMVGAGLVVGRIVNKPTGMASAWLIAAWGAWRLSTVDKVFAATGGSGNVMWLLAVEGLIVAGAGVLLTAVLRGDEGEKEQSVGAKFKAIRQPALWAGVIAGVVVGGIAAHVVGYQPLKGQAFAAAAIGSIGAAAAAHLTMLMLKKDPSPLAGAISIMLLAATGPIVAQLVYGNGLAAALRAGPGLTGGGGILGFCVPISLDWLGGMLLGLPIGEGWAVSMIDKRMNSAPQTTAATETAG